MSTTETRSNQCHFWSHLSIFLVFLTSYIFVLYVPNFCIGYVLLFLWRESSFFYPLALFLGAWARFFLTIIIMRFYKLAFFGKLKENDSFELGKPPELLMSLKKILLGLAQMQYDVIKGTGAYNLMQRMLGADIGTGVCWLGNVCPEPDMIIVSDGIFVSPGVDMFTHNIENKTYTFETIKIGEGCFLGERSALIGPSVMEPSSELGMLAQGMKGSHFKSQRIYAGNPADLVQTRNENTFYA